MKALIRQYVHLAKSFSGEAVRYRAKGGADSHHYYFEQYMHYRSLRRAYMHAARLAKDEMASQAQHRAISRRVKKEIRAAYKVGADLRKAA